MTKPPPMTPRKETLLALAGEAEGAATGDYALDCKIHRSLGRRVPSGFEAQYEGARVPAYSRSLDAAASLAGGWFKISPFGGGRWYAEGKRGKPANGSTPALALCAASLRSLASQQDSPTKQDNPA